MTVPDLCLRCGDDSMYPHFHPGIERFWKCLNCMFEINANEYERRHDCTLSEEEAEVQKEIEGHGREAVHA